MAVNVNYSFQVINIIFFYPRHESQDFRNHKKSVTLERPLLLLLLLYFYLYIYLCASRVGTAGGVFSGVCICVSVSVSVYAETETDHKFM